MTTSRAVRAFPQLPSLVVFVVAALCFSCGDQTDHGSLVPDRVNAVRGLTLPSDAKVLSKSGPTLGRYSATAKWEYETGSEKDVYLSWLHQQLERDNFALKSSDELNLVFTKNSQNESESVVVKIAPSNQKLHVEIAFTIDSD
jgi:hypothetical protein